VDSFDRDATRRELHRMYEEKQHLTLVSIQQALKKDGLFYGKRTSLAKLLNWTGFG